MSAPNYTPGPWGVHVEPVPTTLDACAALNEIVFSTPDFSGELPIVIVAGNGLAVAITGVGPEGRRNAVAIALLPEMVEVLQQCEAALLAPGKGAKRRSLAARLRVMAILAKVLQ